MRPKHIALSNRENATAIAEEEASSAIHDRDRESEYVVTPATVRSRVNMVWWYPNYG